MALPLRCVAAIVPLAVGLAVALVDVPRAEAAMVEVGHEGDPDPNSRISYRRVIYRALPGETNRVTFTQLPADPFPPLDNQDEWVVTDPAGITPGEGCELMNADDNTRAICTFVWPDGLYERFAGPHALLGDGDDRATGAEIMEGGAGNDELRGAGVSYGGVPYWHVFVGGAGDDLMVGRPGPDTFDESDADNGRDTILGGEGGDVGDRVIYAGRTGDVVVDLRRNGEQGEAGEGDTVVDVENVEGGRGNDRLTGTDGPNALRGGGGRDILEGLGGRDFLHGASGDDELRGGPGDDTLDGGGGPDLISGGGGVDELAANSPNQCRRPVRSGIDSPCGGGHSGDRLLSRDGSRDRLTCSRPIGQAIVDRWDENRGCRPSRKRGPIVPVQMDSDLPDVVSVDPLGPYELVLRCPRGARRTCVGSLTALDPGGEVIRRFRIPRGRRGVLRLRASDTLLCELVRGSAPRVRFVVRSQLEGRRRVAYSDAFDPYKPGGPVPNGCSPF